MEVVWALVVAMVLAAIGWIPFSRAMLAWDQQRKARRRDERRHAEQLEWRRRLQAGEGIPVRYETVYKPGEMVDEDVARMAELGYYVADEVTWGDGTRKLVYRLEGVSAL
jgi:hypothetical protein